MSLKHKIRMVLRSWGLDVSRYEPAQSADARLRTLLTFHGVDTVVDVGANDGGFARQVLDSGFKGRVLSFEPQKAVYASLVQKMSKYSNWAAAPSMALGENVGVVELNVAANSASSSVLPMLNAHLIAAPESEYVGKEKVLMHRLDHVDHIFLKQAHAIHLKVDTQGYELPVLMGAKGLMPRVRGLQLEMSLVPLYDGQMLFREMYDWVTAQGFQLMYIVPGFSDQVTGRMLQLDAIFFTD